MLTGCWNYIEIDTRINVSGFAIDKGEHGKKYHLSAEIVTVIQAEKGETEVTVIESDADTIFEGIRNLMPLTAQKLYFGHCKALIIGEAVARDGIAELMDMPIRNHELRIAIDVFVAQGGQGKDILMTEGLYNPIVAYELYDLTKMFSKAVGNSLTSRAYQIYNDLMTEGVSTVIPAVQIQEVDEKKVVKLSGGAVLCKDKLAGYLDELEVKNLSFLRNKMKTGLITIESDKNSDEFMSFEIYKTKSETKLSFENDAPKADIVVNTTITVGELEVPFDFKKAEDIEKIRSMLEEAEEKKFSDLVEKVQTKFGCDVLGLGDLMQKTHPDKWGEYKYNWEATFQKMKVNVKSNITINGSGIQNKSSEESKK